MAEILIRFIRGTAWDSKIIEYRTRAWCSHVEALPTDFDRLTFGAMLKGGVGFRHFDDACYKGVKRWEIWRIPCTQEQRFAFHYFLYKQERKPYDWRAIVSFAFGERDWQENDSWFCSELMVAAGKAAGLWNFTEQVHIDRIDPGAAYLLFTTLAGAHL